MLRGYTPNQAGIKTAVGVSDALGAARETARVWVEDAKSSKDVKIKRATALAMTALANGLRPWDEYER